MEKNIDIYEILVMDRNNSYLLPSGSGFNDDYDVKEYSQTWHITSAYQVMNENGFYDGYQFFKIILPKDKNKWLDDFKLQFCRGNRLSVKYYLRDYMEDTIAGNLEDFLNELEKKDKIIPLTSKNRIDK